MNKHASYNKVDDFMVDSVEQFVADNSKNVVEDSSESEEEPSKSKNCSNGKKGMYYTLIKQN